ncbi:MAG: hypothetical protein JWO82_3386, partial [Akkermansiaceae bacterium]|nr:hypothetical protein [Akkermansiaceae bacterium]
RYTAEDPMKPQKFKEWVIEALGSADAETMEKGIQILIRKLLGE